MAATLAWLDYDAAERERMNRILALFKESDTVDQLGLGAIRDSFSDQLFPGTSTLQNRLRYFLFVPWMYTQLEAKEVPSSRIERRAREFELGWIDVLMATDDTDGVHGKVAGANLKILPSAIYWSGLGSWGIRRFPGTQSEYHRALDAIYRRRKISRRKEDDDAEPDPLVETWHPRLPPPPKGFPDRMDLRLTPGEAEFILDRIVAAHPDSLLAFLARECRHTDAWFPWRHPDAQRFSPAHRELLHHARLLSESMHGAALLYNLMLAELAERDDLIEEHGEWFDEWSSELDVGGLAAWDLRRLWELTLGHGHTITFGARSFVESWVELVRTNPARLKRDPAARQLVRNRELALKGARSYFMNRTLLNQWRGYLGLRRLEYRWSQVRVLLRDLYRGLYGG